MAYTYDQFITAATGAGLLDKFTDDDLNVAKNNPEYGMSALKLHQDLQGASTTEQMLLAQESLNQLRKSYGSGGTAVAAPSSFSYGNQTEYQKLLDEVSNPGSFSYEYQKDPTYQSMKKTYLREGERAREDTLASVAAATGGVPSSAAITAAQQAGDYYAAQLNDSIPTLQQNAYQKYLNELDLKQQGLAALEADRQFAYNNYLQQEQQRQDQLDRETAQEQVDWNRYLQLYDMQQNQQTLAEQQRQQELLEKQQQWENALQIYNQLGYATPEIAEILGLGVEAKTETAQGQYAGTLDGNPDTGSVIDAGIVASLKAMFPGGAVTDEDYWNALLAQYTEADLNAAGIYYKAKETQAQGNGTAAGLAAGLTAKPNLIKGGI